MRTVIIENQQEIEDVIKSCKTCYIGMSDSSGQPYVLPMNFGYADDEFILHSAPTGRMIDILKENPKVCITLCDGDELCWMHEKVACSYRVKSKTIVAEGEVRFIEDFDEKEQYLHKMMKQYTDRTFKFGAPAVRNVCIFVVKPANLSAKEFGATPNTPWVKK
ncbi:pyridoxamine 5'-phosphate oxidase family protein [Puteibacter caeruleilacunae]|nr:pyridoxamine 5'-phosphate oxidase family protein [Puteibacter caeruleilacunae]